MLAELVDNDVTMVDGKVMDENGLFVEISASDKEIYSGTAGDDSDYFEQLQTGYIIVERMLTDLNRTGMIALSDDKIDEIFQNFLQSYFDKLAETPERYESRIKGIDAEIARINAQLKPLEKGSVDDKFGDDWARTYIIGLAKVKRTPPLETNK